MMKCIPFENISKLLSFWKQNNYSQKIEIAALEPLLYRDGSKNIIDICSAACDLGFKCSITTNGFYLKKFAKDFYNKVEKIRVSLHTMDRQTYRNIMGFDGFNQAISGICAAIENGVDVTLNRVLLKGYTNDLQEQIKFVDRHRIKKLKLLDLYYTDEIKKQYRDYYISPEEVLDELIQNDILSFDKENHSNRNRKTYLTKHKNIVEYKLQADFEKNKNNAICSKCHLKENCLEGYADYLRVFPNNKATLCYMREKLDFDIFDENNTLIIKKNSLYDTIPLRLCVVDTCNYHCGFPNDDKSWCLKKARKFNYLAKRAGESKYVE